MVQDAKHAIRVLCRLLERALRSARHLGAALARLVSRHGRRVSTRGGPLADAPIVRRLSGTVSPNLTMDDYRRHLEQKYATTPPGPSQGCQRPDS